MVLVAFSMRACSQDNILRFPLKGCSFTNVTDGDLPLAVGGQ